MLWFKRLFCRHTFLRCVDDAGTGTWIDYQRCPDCGATVGVRRPVPPAPRRDPRGLLD